MRKEVFVIYLILAMVIISTIISTSVNSHTSKISDKTNSEIEKNGKAIVVIDSENADLRGLNIRHRFGSKVSIEISEKDLQKLENNNKIKSVESVGIKNIFLTDAVKIINATSSWMQEISGINLTGKNEAICILDTGINYSHADLGNCSRADFLGGNCSKVIGWDFVNNDADPADDSGHGTHVAGIAAANGGILGVAPEAKIVMMKVCNSAGSCSDDNIKAGLEWCIGNATNYNISVISMSLGSSTLYDSYCDNIDDSMDITGSINKAVGKNISVVIASGNAGSTSKISSPACVQNATAIASSTKFDLISSSSNRNNLTELIAPGNLISSTSISGAYTIKSGTSMATPMAAGSFAIIHELGKLQGESYSTGKIKNALKNTGKIISESSNNYSRIDIYSSILYLDTTPPTIGLNNARLETTNPNQVFYCNATDLQLRNITMTIWNSTSQYYQNTTTFSGTFGEKSLNITLENGNYGWSCSSCDLKNNCKSSVNSSLILTKILTQLVYPLVNIASSTNQTFVCNATSAENLAYLTLYLWNSSSLVYNETKIISGFENSTNFSYNLEFGNYLWNCLASTNNSYSWGYENKSLVYDNLKPELSITSPVNFYSGLPGNVNFEFSVLDDLGLNNCNLVINNNLQEQVVINSTNASLIFTKNLEAGSYSWQINCTDFGGNSNISEIRNLVITQPSPIPASSSSGGGGGGSSSNFIIIRKNITNASNIPKPTNITFSIFNNNSANFTMNENKKSKISGAFLGLVEKNKYFYIALVLIISGVLSLLLRLKNAKKKRKKSKTKYAGK